MMGTLIFYPNITLYCIVDWWMEVPYGHRSGELPILKWQGQAPSKTHGAIGFPTEDCVPKNILCRSNPSYSDAVLWHHHHLQWRLVDWVITAICNGQPLWLWFRTRDGPEPVRKGSSTGAPLPQLLNLILLVLILWAALDPLAGRKASYKWH